MTLKRTFKVKSKIEQLAVISATFIWVICPDTFLWPNISLQPCHWFKILLFHDFERWLLFWLYYRPVFCNFCYIRFLHFILPCWFFFIKKATNAVEITGNFNFCRFHIFFVFNDTQNQLGRRILRRDLQINSCIWCTVFHSWRTKLNRILWVKFQS